MAGARVNEARFKPVFPAGLGGALSLAFLALQEFRASDFGERILTLRRSPTLADYLFSLPFAETIEN